MNAYARPFPSPPAQWLTSVQPPAPSAPAPASYRSHIQDLVDQFRALVTRWRLETYYCSLLEDKIANGAFKEIVAMNEAAIPLILHEIKMRPDWLVAALHLISHENPVPPSAQGKLDEIVNAWLLWAERRKAYAA